MKLGFIGTGNMAGAIMGGVIKSNVFKPEEIIGADLFAPGREKVHQHHAGLRQGGFEMIAVEMIDICHNCTSFLVPCVS